MKTRYYVEVKGHRLLVDANNKNHAAHLAFKMLLRSGRLSHRPPTNNDGWFEDTYVISKGQVGQMGGQVGGQVESNEQ